MNVIFLHKQGEEENKKSFTFQKVAQTNIYVTM